MTKNSVSDVVAPERNTPDPDPNFRKTGSGSAFEIERKKETTFTYLLQANFL
jgi:hypothetical protein